MVSALLDRAVLPDGLGEGTHPQITHQHPIVAGAVEARLICHDSVSLAVVLEVVVTSLCRVCNRESISFSFVPLGLSTTPRANSKSIRHAVKRLIDNTTDE